MIEFRSRNCNKTRGLIMMVRPFSKSWNSCICLNKGQFCLFIISSRLCVQRWRSQPRLWPSRPQVRSCRILRWCEACQAIPRNQCYGRRCVGVCCVVLCRTSNVASKPSCFNFPNKWTASVVLKVLRGGIWMNSYHLAGFQLHPLAEAWEGTWGPQRRHRGERMLVSSSSHILPAWCLCCVVVSVGGGSLVFSKGWECICTCSMSGHFQEPFFFAIEIPILILCVAGSALRSCAQICW